MLTTLAAVTGIFSKASVAPAMHYKKHLDVAWDPSLPDDDTDEYCWTDLQLASREGNLERVKEIIAEDPESINAPPTGYYGQTALQAACMQGHGDVVEALIAAGAERTCARREQLQRNALQLACSGGTCASSRCSSRPAPKSTWP